MFGTKYKGQTLAIDIVSISPSADEKTCAVTPQKSGSVIILLKQNYKTRGKNHDI